MSHGWPMLERDAERSRLQELLDAASSGAGGVLIVESPAGVGKTTLLRHAGALARRARIGTLRATGSELETGFPYGMCRQLLEPALQSLSAGERERLLAGSGALAERALSDQTSFSRSATQAYAAAHGLFRLISALAALGPLLVTVDDAHWGDFASLQFLHYLARRIAGCPIALVIATRPLAGVEVAPPLISLLALDDVAVLRPGPLSAAAVAQLARGFLGEEPAHEFIAACVRATGGSPFLLTELLRELAAERLPPSAAAAAELPGRAPDAVRRRITAALAALGEPATTVARSLAVLGEATLPLLARHAGASVEAVREACRRLEQAGLLDAADAVRFAHPLQASAVAGTIPSGERSQAHLEAARLLFDTGAPLDACAVHLLATRPAASEWVASVLGRAAAAALARGAPAEAAGYAQRALDEPAPAPARAQLLLELGTAMLRLRDVERAEGALRLGLACDPDADVRHAQAITLSQVRYLGGDTDGALDVLEEARSGERDETRLLALDVNAISLGLLDPRRAPLMRARLREYRARALAGALPEPILLALAGAEAVFAVDAEIDGIPLVRQAFALGLTAFDAHTFAFGWAICALDAADLASEAIVHVDEALAAARPLADAALTAYLLSYRTHLALRTGDVAEAEADGRAAYALLARVEEEAPFPLALLDALVERGAAEEAWQLHQQQHFRGSAEHSAMQDLVGARVEITLGRGADALPRLLHAGQELDTMLFRHPQFAPWRAIAVPVALELGQRELAARLAAECLELAQATGAPTALAQALRLKGALEDDLDALARAVELTAATPDLLEHARSLCALGEAQATRGLRDEARQTLRTGLAIAHEAGASTLAEGMRKSLVAVGGRPRRAALRGIEALTPAEFQVARLAARGLSNRDISDELFVALKTVEQHLARAYAKLGISSRRDLPAALKRSSAELPAITAPVALTE